MVVTDGDDVVIDAGFWALAVTGGLTEAQVQRIIEVIAEVDDMTFEGARRKVVDAWEAEAVRAEEQHHTTAGLWAELARIALRVSVDPR